MNYLTIDNVSKAYGDNVLFEHIDMHINKGEKVALIARNGTGKSSLLKILAGIEAPEGVNASVEFHPSIRASFLDQDPDFKPSATIWDTVMEVDTREVRVLARYREALEMGHDDAAFQQILAEMEELHVWDLEAEIQEILSKLHLHESEMKTSELSGGQKKRLALARILIEKPDFLILDEPTNHLDLKMIEWLQNYLSKPELTVLLITHDRYFLENICDVIYELDQGQLFKYAGNYSDYLEKKHIRETNAQIEHEKNKKLMTKEREWVNRMPKARGTKNKARIQSYQELKKEIYAYSTEDELAILWKPSRLGSKIIELHYINKKLGNTQIVKDFNYVFKKGDRLGIIGPNGVGKTSLIKLITQELKPDGGKVVHGMTTRIGHYKQGNENLDPDKTVIETVRDIAEVIPLQKGKKLTARQLCEHFMFGDKKQRVYTAKLSGGEKRRLYLLTILMQNPNILILDEPTNDLDIMTLNVLEDFLLNFPGVLIVVSHDRYFMDKIVDHLFVMEGNGYVRDYPGNYTQYREAKAEGKLPPPPSHIQALIKEKSSSTQAKEQRKSNKKKDKSLKISYHDQKAINRLESKLKKLEKAKELLLKDFEDSINFSADELRAKQIELQALETDIENVELEWMEKVDSLH